MNNYNIQVTVTKDVNDLWTVKDFVVLYQPEPWPPDVFFEVLRCVCSNEEPQETFTWPHRPIIRVHVVKDHLMED